MPAMPAGDAEVPAGAGRARPDDVADGGADGGVDDRPASRAHDLVRWSEALAGIARTGLGFTQSQYERERFEEVLTVAADIAHAAGRPYAPGELIDGWMRSVGDGVAGYQTPKVAVGAVVRNDRDEMLLIERADSRIWLYPTGWADIGYSPSEVAVKEVREETGIHCEVERLIGVFDGLRRGFAAVPLYSVVFLCRATGGELHAHPLECTDLGWFPEDGLPERVAGAEQWAAHAFASIRGETREVLFDPPRTPPWLREGED
jgi:ADP-ribose pyrophosphatase YjhB (NUDIX family)